MPEYENVKNRKEEVERFLTESKPEKFIIIDDDKSLNELDKKLKNKLILTELMRGFNNEMLNKAIALT